MVLAVFSPSTWFGFGVRSEKGRLAEMFSAYYGMVWALGRRLGVAPESLDDAAQQVFLICAERISDIRPGSEKAFLYGTALRTAKSFRRKQGREISTDQGESWASECPAPEELTDRKRTREMLDEVLAEMNEDLRTAFVLHELEELSMREIAELLELAPGTVASRLRRAREVFQEMATRMAKAPKEVLS